MSICLSEQQFLEGNYIAAFCNKSISRCSYQFFWQHWIQKFGITTPDSPCSWSRIDSDAFLIKDFYYGNLHHHSERVGRGGGESYGRSLQNEKINVNSFASRGLASNRLSWKNLSDWTNRSCVDGLSDGWVHEQIKASWKFPASNCHPHQ